MILEEPNPERARMLQENSEGEDEINETTLNGSDLEVVEGFKDLIKEPVSYEADRVLREAHYGNIPEKLKQVVNLHMFTEVRKNPNISRDDFTAVNEDFIKKLERVAEEEKTLEETEGEIVPTIGLEIEVPEKVYASHGKIGVDKKHIKPDEFYKISEKLGVTRGTHDTWEWALDYSHSARVQSLIVHELIQAGFIDTEDSDGGKKLKEGGGWSMHVNLKIPDRLRHNHQQEDFRKHILKKRLYYSSDILTNAFTYAFSSPERLMSRKSNSRQSLGKSAKKIKKKGVSGNETNSESSNSIVENKLLDEVPEGRFEIRSLEVRDKTLYRLLIEIQRSASAMYASHMPINEDNDVDNELSEIWSGFSGKVYDIIDTKIKESGWESLYAKQLFAGGPMEFIDSFRNHAAMMVEKTWIATELRSLITETSLKIEKILKNKQ